MGEVYQPQQIGPNADQIYDDLLDRWASRVLLTDAELEILFERHPELRVGAEARGSTDAA